MEKAEQDLLAKYRYTLFSKSLIVYGCCVWDGFHGYDGCSPFYPMNEVVYVMGLS